MNTDLRFDRNRSRCKQCPCGRSNKDGKFTPYEGFEDKGYCHSCGETFLPELSKESNDWMFEQRSRSSQYNSMNTVNGTAPSFTDFNLFGKSLINWMDVEQIAEQNNFIKYLLSLFDEQTVWGLIHYYNIGTSKHWPGATIFWQADKDANIRSGKVMLYDPFTGKRDKKRFTWTHTILNLPDFKLNQCLFGEHLICSGKPIALVESEKTAIIASVYLPQFTWLATGGKDGLKPERLRVVKNKKIILFPDLNAFDEWQRKANELNDVGYTIAISNYLQQRTTAEQKEQGLDLADYL
ncbi:MAG TPA: DUF6371 domain-containing protein [Niabella sp.]|nr:DUF6371 domain-containing protein [Niabella sp.]